MPQLQIPPEINEIFDKPGPQWTSNDRSRVLAFVNSHPQNLILLTRILRRLPSPATPENAESAWKDFCERRLPGVVVNNYSLREVTNRRFWDYLLNALDNFLWERLNIPPELEIVFDKPGRCWSDEVRRRVWEWLYTSHRRRELLEIAASHLGQDNRAHAEEALSAFGLDFRKRDASKTDARKGDPRQKLMEVFEGYDPKRSVGGGFWGYLIVALKRHCWDYSEQIRKSAGKTDSLDDDTKGNHLGVEPVRGKNPEKIAIESGQNLSLAWCLSELKRTDSRKFEVFIALEYEDKSVIEVSDELGLSKANIKVLNHRAKQKLRACLIAKGVKHG